MKTFNHKNIIMTEYKRESGVYYSCYIPDYDLYFGAKDKEDAERKATFMIKCLLEFNNSYNSQRQGQ